MKRLDRNSVSAPSCLSRYNYKVQQWKNVSKEHLDAIRRELYSMQGNFCAYCECELSESNRHIEHFRRRLNFKELTFDWSNLFLSCKFESGKDRSCGTHKDNDNKTAKYDPNTLINPCDDDPDEFFEFKIMGELETRGGLTAEQNERAKETIRVFNLNCTRLKNMRKRTISTYSELVRKAKLQGTSDNEIYELMADILDYAKDKEFYTAVRHVVTK